MNTPTSVRITQTTTTTSASVIMINTGYLSTKFGILKISLAVLSMVCFILLLLAPEHVKQSLEGSSYKFLLLITFSHCYTIFLMLFCCLLCLTTAALLPKTTFDFAYHFLATILYLISGSVSISTYSSSTSKIYQTACIFALILSVIHLIHGIFSFRTWKQH